MKNKESEFGKGFVYNLVLFAKHFERWESYEKAITFYNMASDCWFNGAADHLYELEIPERFVDTEIGRLAESLQKEALSRRLETTSKEEFCTFFEKLEKLTMMIDEYLGLEPVKAQYN